jgi:Zn-dependent protease with chaperone function
MRAGRSFQAAPRLISASDEVRQEIVDLKRGSFLHNNRPLCAWAVRSDGLVFGFQLHPMQNTPPLPGPAPVGLDPRNLNIDAEGKYFAAVLVISIAIWALIAISIIGLFYAVFIGFFVWLANGLLTAHLRSEAIRVDATQLPELHATFLKVCQQLGVVHPPAFYVVQAGGLLNAFATRFAGRDFVVVYSDFVEALGTSSPEMQFVLGHELGHIRSRHVWKQIILAPGLFFPLIGPAYRRAWESSADRYGAYAAQDVDGAVRAMLVLSAGPEQSRSVNAEAFAGQYRDERGFFVSLHELSSTYPTLSRRVTDLMSLRDGQAVQRPSRHPLAYLVGMLLPGGNIGGGGATGMMLIVVMIGMMSAMAIPAFQKVRQSSLALSCVNNQRMLSAALDQFRLEHPEGATNWDDIAGPGKILPNMPKCPLHGTYSADSTENGYVVACSLPAHAPGAARKAPN